MYTAMQSGPSTFFLSRDKLRPYSTLLNESRPLLERWQRSSQITFYSGIHSKLVHVKVSQFLISLVTSQMRNIGRVPPCHKFSVCQRFPPFLAFEPCCQPVCPIRRGVTWHLVLPVSYIPMCSSAI
jgi:hypothetical protein